MIPNSILLHVRHFVFIFPKNNMMYLLVNCFFTIHFCDTSSLTSFVFILQRCHQIQQLKLFNITVPKNVIRTYLLNIQSLIVLITMASNWISKTKMKTSLLLLTVYLNLRWNSMAAMNFMPWVQPLLLYRVLLWQWMVINCAMTVALLLMAENYNEVLHCTHMHVHGNVDVHWK